MHCAQQFLADRQFVVAALDRGANGLQVLRHFAAQDFQQHRIHRRHHRQSEHRLTRPGRAGGDGRSGGSSGGSSSIGIGKAGLRHRFRFDTGSRHAPDHLAPDRLRGTWRLIFQTRGMARRKLFGSLHDRAERDVRSALALERGQQLRQRINGMAHQVLHVLIRFDRLVEHAIQHVLDFPRELAQHASSHQSTGALQGVERAADADQGGGLRRIGQPDFFRLREVVDFLLHFFQEDLANIVVDALGVHIEAGIRCERVENRHLFDHLFLNLDPVFIRMRHGAPVRCRRPARLGFRQAEPVEIMRMFGRRLSLADEQPAEVLARQQADRLGQLGMLFLVHVDLDMGRGGHRLYSHMLRRDAHGRRRPIAQLTKTVLSHVQNMLEPAAVFARCLEVVLEGSQRIGQVIHLRTAGHATILQQFIVDEPANTLGEFGRARRRQHAHGAGHFIHQRRGTGQTVVLPAGFHEGHDGVLHAAGIADRFLHQGGYDAERFAARHALHGLAAW